MRRFNTTPATGQVGKRTQKWCQSVLGGSATLLLLSGILHGPIWLFSDTAWEGPVSWRKPILFGISTGLTLWSFAWLWPRWPAGRWDRMLSGLLAASLVAEVALITLQAWRRQASHFNHATTFDGLIEILMTILIAVAFAIIVSLAVRTFGRMDMTPDIRLAVRGGMVFLVLSCVIGFAILVHGYQQLNTGANPSTYGKQGVTKFPHGVAIHALQILPMICWGLRSVGVTLTTRIRCMAIGIWGFAVLLLFSVSQTLSGRGRLDAEFSSIMFWLTAFAVPASLAFLWRPGQVCQQPGS